VIHREWRQQGKLTTRHDLGLKGRAIRRMTYSDGKAVTREYFNRDGVRLSRESFDTDGFITEQVAYAASGQENDHWYFERGTPVRQVRKGKEYVKQGQRFGFVQGGEFIDAPFTVAAPVDIELSTAGTVGAIP
jgi:hypothetical protein